MGGGGGGQIRNDQADCTFHFMYLILRLSTSLKIAMSEATVLSIAFKFIKCLTRDRNKKLRLTGVVMAAHFHIPILRVDWLVASSLH